MLETSMLETSESLDPFKAVNAISCRQELGALVEQLKRVEQALYSFNMKHTRAGRLAVKNDVSLSIFAVIHQHSPIHSDQGVSPAIFILPRNFRNHGQATNLYYKILKLDYVTLGISMLLFNR